jgi:penicillin-binding protein 2
LWKHRDHGHFICFAPFDKPRYACAVVIQHGGGSAAAYPVARDVMTFLFDPKVPDIPSLGLNQEHLDLVHKAMSDVINGPGTAGRARLPIPDVLMAGKTGTAQVVGLNVSSGKGGIWKHRDHGHFICFAPFDNPRYACAVVIEHGGGSSAAYPVARDVMTYLFDPAKAMDVLLEMEKGWGGTPQQRMTTKYNSYAAKYGAGAPKVEQSPEAQVKSEEGIREGAPAQPIVSSAATPPPEPDANPSPAPTPTSSPAR